MAVLGDMLELGPRERDYHVELGDEVARAGVEVLVTVGPLAAADRRAVRRRGALGSGRRRGGRARPELLRPGDVVLVKGSRGVGLELVCRALTAVTPARTAREAA